MDADGQVAGLWELGINVECPATGVGRERAGIVSARDTKGQQLAPERAQRALGGFGIRWRDAVDDQAAGVLEEHAGRRPVVAALDDPAVGVGGAIGEPGGGERRRARPDRVMVERAQRNPATRCDRLEITGRWPSAPSTLVPATPQNPGLAGQAPGPGSD